MHIRLLLTFAALICLPSAHAQDVPKEVPANSASQNTDVAAKANNPTAVVTDVDYKIGPQDVVRIDVWKEPEISRTIPVRPDGKISLPLLNDVQAAGLTATQLGNAIHDGLTKYLNSPQVTVTVMEINSRRVYVTGEVLRAGAPSSPAEHDRSSGSVQRRWLHSVCKTQKHLCSPERRRKTSKHPFNYKEVVKGKNQEQNILLLPGDVIVVP